MEHNRGEKTLTFTVEDALLSPIGFAVLSGAGLFQGDYTKEKTVHVHRTSQVYSSASGNGLDLTDALSEKEQVCGTAPVFVVEAEKDGSVTGEIVEGMKVDDTGKKLMGTVKPSTSYFVDYYVIKPSNAVDELQIDAENFAGYYYVEASTLFRRQDDGKDMPAELTFPNVKIQSNFTFTMASTGDPSTFTFTMDAFPGYTYFEPTRKVLCAIQVIDESVAEASNIKPVFPHTHDESIVEAEDDSVTPAIIMAQDANTGLGDVKVSELMAPGAKIDDNGNVTAELLYKKGFTEFNGSNEEEQKGYYFPTQIDVPEAEKMELWKKNGSEVYQRVRDKQDYDNTIVIRTGEDTGEQIITDVKILTFADATTEKPLTTTELHFDNVTFRPKESED